MSNNYLLASFAIPLVLGMFKKEILSLWSDYRTWKLRVVKEGTILEILNPNIGSWSKVEVLDYTFNISAADRVVTFHYLDGSGRIESVPFAVWASFRKNIISQP